MSSLKIAKVVDKERRNAPTRINNAEVMSFLIFWLLNEVDLLMFSRQLHGLHILTTPLLRDVTTKFWQDCDRVELCEILVNHLSANTNIPDLLKVFYRCGYINIAYKLFQTVLKLKSSGISHVHRSKSGQYSVMNVYCKRLKRWIHDGYFKHPQCLLKQLANASVEKTEKEPDPIRKQHLADISVAQLGLEIDATAITLDNDLYCVFAQLKRMILESSNTYIGDIIYYVHLAIAYFIAGNFKTSDALFVEARCKAYSTGPCLVIVYMSYIEVCANLWRYEHNPSKEVRDSLMMWARIGIECLEEEDEDTKMFWRRLFMIRMLYCLLGLGYRANIIDGCEVDNASIKEATDLFAEIDKALDDSIEIQQHNFYFLARKRLKELKTQYSKKIKSAQQLPALMPMPFASGVWRNYSVPWPFSYLSIVLMHVPDSDDVPNYRKLDTLGLHQFNQTGKHHQRRTKFSNRPWDISL